MKAAEAIKKNQVTLLTFKSNPEKTLLELCKQFSRNGLAMVVSSNPADLVLKRLEQNHINSSNIIFIDCISKKDTSSKNIIYTSGPGALTQLSLAVSQLLKSKGIEVVILDSVSSLLIHNQDITLVRFIQDLVSKVRRTNKKLILTLLAKDNKGSLASVPLFVDVVVGG